MDELAEIGTGKIALVLILSLALGVVLGLFVAWMVWPVQLYEGPPHLLKQKWKDDFLYLISAGYAVEGDKGKARERLKTLGVVDPDVALATLARKLEAEGAPEKSLQALAMLASSLGTPEPELQAHLPTPFPTPTFTPVSVPPPFTPSLTETPLPEPTPTETPGPTFVLKAREMRCHSDEETPLLKIEILDSEGKPLPGIEVVVSWEGGEERLFTGLKPDKSPGYTDFTMARTYTYRVRVNAPASEEAQDLVASSGECPAERPLSSWHIVFQEIRR